jgi:hypothetical protein
MFGQSRLKPSLKFELGNRAETQTINRILHKQTVLDTGNFMSLCELGEKPD